jgi:pilus assembly protein CpaB
MATRFGGNPAYALSVKLRYIVGALAVVVIALLIALIGVLTMKKEAPEQQQNAGTLTQQSPLASTRVEVLVAQARIEAGMQFQRGLFVARQYEPDQIPEGAVTSREEELLIGKFAKEMIAPNMPILKENVQDTPPLSALNIPAGFRAVTIMVDSRSGVEGFAKPGTRVDVLFTFVDRDGKKKVATLSRFIKVLSMGGNVTIEGKAAISGSVDVTLLVTERDAKRIELARNVGTLSLALVGDVEQGKPRADDIDSVDINDITGTRDPVTQEEPAQGYMYMKDPVTGRQVKFKLKSGGKWEKDSEAAGQ